MRVVVIGGAGFIGGHLVDALIDAEFRTRPDRLMTARLAGIACGLPVVAQHFATLLRSNENGPGDS